MIRILFAAIFLVVVGVARAQDENLDAVQIKVTKVAGNVYLLQGAGGNMAASVGQDGIVLVDDEFAPLAERIAGALKSIGVTDKPVRFVINTHYHGDHAGGNAAFATGGSTVIAQENVRKRLQSGGVAGNGGSVKMDVKPAASAALPLITFEHDVTVHLNGEDIRALYVPAGHTDGDSIIYFPKAKVVHLGDDYVQYGYPFIDVSSGGSVQGIIAACEKVLATMPADVIVIPGHGELSNLTQLREYVQMLKDTSARVAAAMASGQTAEQAKKSQILAKWDKRYSGDFINSDAFIDTLYNSLGARKAAPVLRHN